MAMSTLTCDNFCGVWTVDQSTVDSRFKDMDAPLLRHAKIDAAFLHGQIQSITPKYLLVSYSLLP